jgi:hypothetical protein
MASTSPSQVDVDRLDTWTRYRNGLCTGCVANCCTMPVEVRLPDLVRLQLVDAFEAEHEAPKQIARRLAKAGVVEHFNFKRSIFTLARRASGDCLYLDDRRAAARPNSAPTPAARPQVGPRPGYCAYARRPGRGPGRRRADHPAGPGVGGSLGAGGPWSVPAAAGLGRRPFWAIIRASAVCPPGRGGADFSPTFQVPDPCTKPPGISSATGSRSPGTG